MLDFITQALLNFRTDFSRERTWLLFGAVVLGFIASPEMIGVTSICRFWMCNESGYNSLLHFFRSKAYEYAALVMTWQRFALNQNATIEVNDRCVLLGDHTDVVKDGGRMPGVVSLHEHSETQSKPSYFRGQFWGAICLLIGSMAEPFGLPLELQLHQGFKHLGEDDNKEKLSIAERIIQMALLFAIAHDRPAYLVLDAFFSTGTVFLLARSVYSIALKEPYLQIITRAKKSYVAYFPAPTKPANRPGPQAFYGEKVHLMDIFNYLHLFETVECMVYGKMESIKLFSIPLLWRPIGDCILFVFAVTSRGPIVLMSSDLNISPILVIELYCVRSRIEVMFDVLKNLIGAFMFRFWSKYLPLHSRTPTSNKDLKAPLPEHVSNVASCWQAYEIFVLCAAIATGLLQLIALKFGSEVWNQHVLYLRTKSRYIPSEKTVRQVLVSLILKELINLPSNSVIAKIRQYLSYHKDDDECHEYDQAA